MPETRPLWPHAPTHQLAVRGTYFVSLFSDQYSGEIPPNRKVLKPLGPEPLPSGLECVTMEFVSLDGKELDLRAFFRHGDGVLFAHLTAPNTPESRAEYERFKKSVEPLTKPAVRREEAAVSSMSASERTSSVTPAEAAD